ncbi:hypothetical protein C4D60_Mb04t03220 [Musa balbisiana]|uniref:RRM domain-containing protein n=1 Tax=Musa balbisiana TaxID=52838 RepID=A0A4V6T4Q7_MUSBA|nr:hypothetical protein C4D60_Mb04t03220 [Musa balbisiana]
MVWISHVSLVRLSDLFLFTNSKGVGLSYGTDDQSLRETFTNYGEVVEARVIIDRETGRSRGFGFVTFTSNEEASAAISGMDGKIRFIVIILEIVLVVVTISTIVAEAAAKACGFTPTIGTPTISSIAATFCNNTTVAATTTTIGNAIITTNTSIIIPTTSTIMATSGAGILTYWIGLRLIRYPYDPGSNEV